MQLELKQLSPRQVQRLAKCRPGLLREKVRDSGCSLITLFQVSDRDSGGRRVTGLASLGYWKGREEEALEKNKYGYFMKCEIAHGVPWSVDQPVRDDVYVPC
jgi:hypothetical protein